MNNPDAAGRAIGPRTWRAAAVLFLTVLLAGAGLTGASALWAQSGVVTAQVSTGTWVDYSRSGFSMPVTMTVDDAKDAPWVRRSIRLSWTNASGLNPSTHKVTYRVEATEDHRLEVHEPKRPTQGSAAEVTFVTSKPLRGWPPESFRVTVTPYVNGVAGTPTVKNLWLDSSDRTWLTDVK